MSGVVCEIYGHRFEGQPVYGTADLKNGAPMYVCILCGEPGWNLDQLTPQQRRLLDCILLTLEEKGYPPSIKELADFAGYTSTSSVAHQLKNLERKGYIQRDSSKARAITVTEAGWQS